MGKVEDMRALRMQMREGLARTAVDLPALAAGKKPKRAAATPVAAADEGQELCGHTAISGKRCSRPKDHSEKNHRYPKA